MDWYKVVFRFICMVLNVVFCKKFEIFNLDIFDCLIYNFFGRIWFMNVILYYKWEESFVNEVNNDFICFFLIIYVNFN